MLAFRYHFMAIARKKSGILYKFQYLKNQSQMFVVDQIFTRKFFTSILSRPELEYIDMLEPSTTNVGYYTIAPNNYRQRDNRIHTDMQFGFIKINLTNPEQYAGLSVSP